MSRFILKFQKYKQPLLWSLCPHNIQIQLETWCTKMTLPFSINLYKRHTYIIPRNLKCVESFIFYHLGFFSVEILIYAQKQKEIYDKLPYSWWSRYYNYWDFTMFLFFYCFIFYWRFFWGKNIRYLIILSLHISQLYRLWF